MSLDIYLRLPANSETGGDPTPETEERIFIREGGQNKEISREEFYERFPGREPVAFVPDLQRVREADVGLGPRDRLAPQRVPSDRCRSRGRRLMIYLAFALTTISGYVWMIRSLAGAK